jgi:protein tyrosine phosphatase
VALDIVQSRLSDDNLLGDEYHAVVMRDRLIDHTTDQSQLPEHSSRNRYVNVLPYDFNRVKISTTPGER